MKRLIANKINFIPRLAEGASEDARKKQKMKTLLPLIVALLLVISVSSFFAINIYFVIMPELKDLRDYTNNAVVQDDYNKALDLQSELESWHTILAQQKTAFDSINSYPEMTEDDYQIITAQTYGQIDISTIQYQRNEGALIFDCTAPGPLEAAAYAEAVESTGYFTSVYYYGYASADNSAGQQSYDFNVVCGMFPMRGETDE